MKKAKTFKRVGAILLTLAMLVGMISVCGTFSFAVSAESESTANKFVADFSELGKLLEGATMKDSADNTHYETAYTPIGDTETLDGKINTWMRERFASTTNHAYSTTRAWFAQKSDEISDAEANGWGKNGNITGFALTENGTLRLRVMNASGANMMRRVDTLIPQFYGENAKLKNFKMTIKYRNYLHTNRGAMTVAFDETKAGYIPALPNTYGEIGYRRTATGSTLVLGNGTGMEQPAGNDGWIFYNKKSVISATTVDEKHYSDPSIAWRELKPGSDYKMENGDVVYERFETESSQQIYTLTVEVKNGKAVFTTVSEDGTRNETMEMAYTPSGGFVSIGMSNRDYVISYVDIEEYDDEGNAVDFGTYHNNQKGVDKAVEVFEADFTDLPDVNYVDNQYLYNVNHDTSTGKGIGLTTIGSKTLSSVGANATTYTVDVKDKALVDYLESKFDFYTYANGGGGTFPMWNAAGYVVDAEGNPLGSGFANSNPYNPATGIAGGAYMPGSGSGGYWNAGFYPTMKISENKWFHIASDIDGNAMNPFDIVYSYALNDANGDKAVLKNFKLDLDFKLTTASATSFPQNQSPVFVKFGGYDNVKHGDTDGAMFSISCNGEYFLDDLNTVVNGSTFTATKDTDNAPYYTETAGAAIREAHLTLTVKNGTVNAVVTLADGTKVLDVTKSDIAIQDGLIHIGTTYAGIKHGLPYFGAVKVVRLDDKGNPIDFTGGDEGTFDAHFVGLTEVVDTCYYRDLNTKNNSIMTGKSNVWLTNAVGIANVDDKDNDGYAFGAEDTNIVNYLNDKFDFYHAAPNGTLTKMPSPYQNADEIYLDSSYSGGQWKLAGGRWLRATFDNGVYWNDAFRKQMILVPKMDGKPVETADQHLEFNFAHGTVNNGNSYSAALIMLRSAEIAKTESAAGAYTDGIAVRITHYGISVYDGTSPAKTHGHTMDDQFLFGGNTNTAHVSLDLNGNELKVKATTLDGATTLIDETVNVSNCMDAGYTYMSVCNSDMAFADIESTPVPVPLEWIDGLPTYCKDYSGTNEEYFGSKTYIIENTNAAEYTAYLTAVEQAGWIKVSDNNAANNLFATYQKDGQAVYIYYLATENRVHVVEMEENAVLPDAEAAYTKVCEPLFTQVQLSYATASEGMSYLVRLSDGRFIVIDGGQKEADYLESKHLYNLMKEQNVLDKITIAAWIVTHAHGDHQQVPIEFMNYYTANDITIEQVLFNYPADTANAAQTNAFVAAVNAWGDSGTKRVTPYIGQEFYYADAKIEILHTIDAYAPGQIDGEDFNNTSTVFTIELGGQKIMILGDMHTIGNDHLVKLYGSYLKSDISQWAHHGVGGATRELYVEIDPAVIVLPAGVFHHTNTYNYYRYHAPADDRTGQSFKWLYYPENDETNHVKEVFLMGFKEVTLTLPYTSPEDCEYMQYRNNNGYVFEEAAESDATVPNPFYELNVGEETNTVYYKDFACAVPSKRVEKNAAVESYSVAGLSDVLNGNNSFELFIAIDKLPDVLTGETYYMFGTSTNGLTLENNTLNVSLRRGENTAVITNGGRYYRGNVVGGGVVNHIIGTYDAASNTLAVYKNGVLITTTKYTQGYTAEDVLNLGSTGFNSKSGYTVLGARVYDVALSGEQVAATYWNAIDSLPKNGAVLDTATNVITVYSEDGYELKAGSLLAKDAQGNKFVPTRVGFRNGGDASRYQANETAVAIEYEFTKATLDNPNIGLVGISFNKDQHGIRFVSRFTRRAIDGVEYVVVGDGSKYAIKDYGLLVASESGLATTNASATEDMVVGTANGYVKQLSALQSNKYYDICSDYIDLSVSIINMDKVANFDAIKDMNMYARTYIIVEVDGEERVLYSDVFDSTYYDALGGVTTSATMTELRESEKLLINGRHIIADQDTNKGFVEAGDIVVDFGNAGITIAGDLVGDIYMDVAYNMYANGECRINVMVDGEYVDDVVVKYGESNVKVVSGLKGGYHTVTIAKGVGTPSLGDLVFKSVTYNGSLETAPAVNDLQFMFLGDSITDTAGILGAYADAPDPAGQQLPSQNIRLGYAALTAKAFGADFTQVSFAGLTTSQVQCLFNEEAFPQGGTMIPYEYGSGDTTEKDVVVINLGTNNPASTVNSEAKACLDAVRAKYPNAYIVWTYGMMFTTNDQALSDAVAEWVAQTGDTKTSYCSLSAAANTDGGAQHPLAPYHAQAAEILTQHIANLLNAE